VPDIAAESQRRTQLMIDFATERGWTINTPLDKNERGGSVMIGVNDAPVMAERLAERKVFVDWRPSAGLRMSPHFFNTDEEVVEALNILAELMEQ
jgi:kynureninase